jgi:hypothetical protein
MNSEAFPDARRPFSEGWRDLRRRERALWVIALALVVLIGGSRVLGLVAFLALPLSVVVLALFVLLALAWLVRGAFACPRCRKFFFLRPFWANPLTVHCLHCGLRRGAEE